MPWHQEELHAEDEAAAAARVSQEDRNGAPQGFRWCFEGSTEMQCQKCFKTFKQVGRAEAHRGTATCQTEAAKRLRERLRKRVAGTLVRAPVQLRVARSSSACAPNPDAAVAPCCRLRQVPPPRGRTGPGAPRALTAPHAAPRAPGVPEDEAAEGGAGRQPFSVRARRAPRPRAALTRARVRRSWWCSSA